MHLSETIDDSSLRAAWARLPGALVLTGYRRTADVANECALSALPGRPIHIPIWEITKAGGVRRWISVKVGCKLMATSNIDLDNGVANGTLFELLHVGPGVLTVLLADGQPFSIPRSPRTLQTETGDTLRGLAFDVTLGAALTVHKAEGQSLDAVILAFDGFSAPGWAYTAVTRATSREKLVLLGHCPLELFEPRPRHPVTAPPATAAARQKRRRQS